MHCNDAQENLSPWHDGELGRWQTLRLRRHLHGCARCQMESDALRALTARVASADPLAGQVFGTLAPVPNGLGFVRPSLLAVSLLLVSIGVYWWRPEPVSNRSSRRQAVLPLQRTTSQSRRFAALPRPQTTIKRALQPATPHPAQRRKTFVRLAMAALPCPVRLRHPALRPVSATAKFPVQRTLPPHPTPGALPEIIQVSVKVTDPQEAVRQMRAEMAAAQRIEEERQFIYVAALPELAQDPQPAVVLSTANDYEEQR